MILILPSCTSMKELEFCPPNRKINEFEFCTEMITQLTSLTEPNKISDKIFTKIFIAKFEQICSTSKIGICILAENFGFLNSIVRNADEQNWNVGIVTWSSLISFFRRCSVAQSLNEPCNISIKFNFRFLFWRPLWLLSWLDAKIQSINSLAQTRKCKMKKREIRNIYGISFVHFVQFDCFS